MVVTLQAQFVSHGTGSVMVLQALPLTLFRGPCPECPKHLVNHYWLHPPHKLLSQPLGCVELFVLRPPDVASTWYNIYHYGCLLLLRLVITSLWERSTIELGLNCTCGVVDPSLYRACAFGAIGRIFQYQVFLSAGGACCAEVCLSMMFPFSVFLLPQQNHVLTRHTISCGHVPGVLMDLSRFILNSGSDFHWFLASFLSLCIVSGCWTWAESLHAQNVAPC